MRIQTEPLPTDKSAGLGWRGGIRDAMLLVRLKMRVEQHGLLQVLVRPCIVLGVLGAFFGGSPLL